MAHDFFSPFDQSNSKLEKYVNDYWFVCYINQNNAVGVDNVCCLFKHILAFTKSVMRAYLGLIMHKTKLDRIDMVELHVLRRSPLQICNRDYLTALQVTIIILPLDCVHMTSQSTALCGPYLVVSSRLLCFSSLS